jgi:hypothetical protein
MREISVRLFICLSVFFILSIGLVARDNSVDASDATSTLQDELARMILELESFDDLLKMEAFFNSESSVFDIFEESGYSTGTLIESDMPPILDRPNSASSTSTTAHIPAVFIDYEGGPLPGGVDMFFEPGNIALGIPDIVSFHRDGTLIETLSAKTILRPLIAIDTPVKGSSTAVFRFLTGEYSTPLGAFFLSAVDSGIFTLTVALDPRQSSIVIDIDGNGSTELLAIDDHMVNALEITELSVFRRFFVWTDEGWRVDSPGDFREEYEKIAAMNLEDINTRSPRTPHVWSYAYHSYMAGKPVEDISQKVSILVDEYYLHWLIDPLEVARLIDGNINRFLGYVRERPLESVSPNM